MKWLENPQSEADTLIREGLDLAAQRTGDEITHRRVWAKVADAACEPERRFPTRLVLASASVALAVFAVAGVVVYPYLGSRVPSTAQDTPQITVPAPAPQAAPALPQGAPPAQVAAGEEPRRLPGNVVRTRKGERARVALGGGASAELAENSAITWDNQYRPSIERGSAQLSVPHQPPGWRFSVTAGPYVVTVIGTKFRVEVGSRSVGVEVTEGVVEVWRGSRVNRLVAGDTWRGPLRPDESASPSAAAAARAPSERPSPTTSTNSAPATNSAASKPAAMANRALHDAEAAVEAGETDHAVEILARAAQGTGPAAENAAYELARVTRYNLGRPRQAIALWNKYRTRFPAGLLRTEADLSIVETLSQIGEVRAALTEANAFLTRHPNSERRAEVQRLVERLRAVEAGSAER